MTEDIIERLKRALHGRYRIERELGEGGMATVWLADDLKHDRKVAIKVLRPELAALVGAERFLAEIRTTARLQHPHILTLHDSGEADGFLFYVMPYVQGDSLRDRLDRERQLPVAEAVGIAIKVASALHAAHRQGVVHRDIKPANILLEDGEPTVADFGIALAVSQAGGGRLTETGLSLGTPHYMSPEQASGERDVDRRSDIYALGCVVYEMLAGEPPFSGPTSQAVLARILTTDPQRVAEVRRTVPPHVDAAVACAVEKLPADRFESAEAFADALRNPSFRHAVADASVGPAALPGGRSAAPGSRLRWILVGAAATLALVLIGAAALGLLDIGEQPSASTGTIPTSRFALDLGEHEIDGSQLDISSDGRLLVYATGGDQPLHLRAMDELESGPVPGTEGARWPVFSPDGEWIAFVAGVDIRRVAVSGGEPLPVTVGRIKFPAALHWGEDGSFVYYQADGVYRVSGQGGDPERILESPTPFTRRSPRLLPGGEAVIFSEFEGPYLEGGGAIRVLELESGDVRTLVERGLDARYVETGHLVYGMPGGTLFAVPFDVERLEVTGPPFPVLDGVWVMPGIGFTAFVASEVGTVAYVSGSESAADRALVLVHRSGGRETLPLPTGAVDLPRFSPDGRKLAYVGQAHIFVYDLVVGTNTRITSEGVNTLPVWTRDGEAIAFASIREGTDGFDIHLAPASGDGEVERLWTEEAGQWPESWSADGRHLLYTADRTDAEDQDLAILDLTGEAASTTPYLAADWSEWRGRISPDGRWVAYESDEDGLMAIYVRSFPEPGPKIRISEGPGRSSRWSPDGDALYYWRGDTLVAARVRTEPFFEVLSRSDVLVGDYDEQWDVRPDGQAFVFSAPAEAVTPGAGGNGGERPDPLIVVVNWFDELRARMEGGR